jgi:hypothetical protein
MYSRVRTYILAMVAAAMAMVLASVGGAAIQSALFPWPPGTDISVPATTAAAVAAMPLLAKLLLIVEWAVGDLLVFAVAIWANGFRKSILWLAWLVPLIGVGSNFSEYPYPDWMIVAGVAAVPLAGVAACLAIPGRR